MMKLSDLGMLAQPVPMTSTQVGFLVESQLSDKPALNVLQVIVHLGAGAVHVGHLQHAWQIVTPRHDGLRLCLDPLAEDGPRQWALPSVEVDFLHLDWRDHDSARFPAAFEDWLEQDRQQPLRLDVAPGWRVRLITNTDDHAEMVWTFHHATLDGGAVRLVIQEVFAAYSALCDGQPVDFGPRPAASFIAHCRALAALDHGPAQSFFRQHLAGFDAPNQLDEVFLTDTPHSDQERHAIHHQLGAVEADRLRQRAQDWGVTMADMITAAWGLVMARCSGRDEAVFGVTRSGRFLLPGVTESSGCRINTLPCRVLLRGQSLIDLLRAIRRFTLAIRDFEHTPLSAIVEVSDLPRTGPPFNSIVMFDRGTLGGMLKDACPRFDRFHVRERGQMSSGLMLGAYDDQDLKLLLEYDPSQYSQSGAARLVDYTMAVLRAMAAQDLLPETPLALIDMLPQAERETLMSRSRPFRPAAPTQPLIDGFEEIVRRYPDRIALHHIGQDDSLTYAQLDASANHLAHHLRASGICPGDIVGLALPRGQDYIAAMLAVLKAEAAFMPLDLGYPARLLQNMIRRSGAVMLLTSGDGMRHLGAQNIPVSRIDLPGQRQGAATAPPRGDMDPHRPAYVIFTSGSSGEPKGVAVPQTAINHHVAAIREAFALSRDDHVLQFTSLNFDISIEEILPTLLSGARLVLRSEEMAQDIPAFLSAMQREAVSVANLPTAFWHVLCAELAEMPAPPDLSAHLRLMVVGGERPSAAAAARWHSMFPAMRWMNGYGPTEATITATLHDATDIPPDGAEQQDIPIGRPTGGARAYVMAADGSFAPDGTKGELWIGGQVVANGYIGRPDLTAEVFVPDPVLGAPARAYRSGDLASWLPDGSLVYHGRMDRQIKLRGFRIELGAIQAALEDVPQVTAAIVGLDNPGSDNARLMAWITTREPMTPEALDALNAALRDQLPSHMVPRIVPTDHFPQTPGGKIDMARLPRPADNSAESSVPPDAATRQVQRIFCQLLRLPAIGPDQSFFEIGGNSLLSVRLMGLIERDFGRRIGLATLYQNATPRQLAAEIARSNGQSDFDHQQYIVPIQPLGSNPSIYAIHILGPGGSFFRPLAQHLGPDQPLIGLTANLLDPSSPKTLPEIAALYCETILRNSPDGALRLVAVSQGSFIALELAQQLIARGRQVQGLYLIDAAGPGGRPMRQVPHSLRHYASRLYRNLPGVFRGRLRHYSDELRFHLTRLRLAVNQWRGADISQLAHNAMAHQAVIDLAINAYQPHEYPGEITVFRATTPDLDTAEGLESGLGWALVAPGRVRVIDTQGDHLSILAEPDVASFANHLRHLLAGASGPAPQ